MTLRHDILPKGVHSHPYTHQAIFRLQASVVCEPKESVDYGKIGGMRRQVVGSGWK